MSGVWLALAVIYHKAGVSWSFIIPLIPFQIPTIHDVYYYRALAYIPLTVLAVPASILTVRAISISSCYEPCPFSFL
jgi:hypothetical protein